MNKLNLILPFCCFAFASSLFAQNSARRTYSFLGKTNVYYLMQPADKINGILVLFPGKGEKANSIFGKTNLPEILQTRK